MNLSQLKPATGSTHKVKRIGRGTGSGHGGTSKFGFTNINRKEFKAINLSTIQMLAEKFALSEVTVDTLIEHGLANKSDRVKILGNGELKTKLNVKAHAFSKSAQEAIEKIQGTTEII